MQLLGLVFALVAATSPPAPAPVITADVLIGAGHEGRPASCARFPKRACNLGTPGERERTALVADEATRVLREAGVSVARVPADFDGRYDVRSAIFIHYDGNSVPCRSGASVGYHHAADEPAAAAWKALYGKYIPFGFQPDNFTKNLSNYYGFRQVDAPDGALVLELGELTCPSQRAWLEPRVQWAGRLIAHFVSARIGKGNVPDPGPQR